MKSHGVSILVLHPKSEGIELPCLHRYSVADIRSLKLVVNVHTMSGDKVIDAYVDQ